MANASWADTFYRHIDTCQHCRDNPFDLCVTGAIWLKTAAEESARKFMGMLDGATPESESK